jgi:hypothetical protein
MRGPTRNNALRELQWHAHDPRGFDAFKAGAGRRLNNAWRWCVCVPDGVTLKQLTFINALVACIRYRNMTVLEVGSRDVGSLYSTLRHINKIVVRFQCDLLAWTPPRAVVDRVEVWERGMWTVRSVELCPDAASFVDSVLNDAA